MHAQFEVVYKRPWHICGDRVSHSEHGASARLADVSGDALIKSPALANFEEQQAFQKYWTPLFLLELYSRRQKCWTPRFLRELCSRRQKYWTPHFFRICTVNDGNVEPPILLVLCLRLNS